MPIALVDAYGLRAYHDLFTVANQKAKYVAQKLNKIVKDQEHTKPFEFHNKGSLAYLGDWCVALNQ